MRRKSGAFRKGLALRPPWCYKWRGRPDVYSSWAFFVRSNHQARGIQVALQSHSQLHKYRGRRGRVLRLDAESWCLLIGLCLTGTPKRSGFVVDQRSELTLAIATDAVSNPTTRDISSGGIHGEREGSSPSSTTEHQCGAPLLNNDRVVQRRRAGQRSLDKYRPAPSSPHAQHAAVGRWLRRCSHSRSS
jgi:hypothetical protein